MIDFIGSVIELIGWLIVLVCAIVFFPLALAWHILTSLAGVKL